MNGIIDQFKSVISLKTEKRVPEWAASADIAVFGASHIGKEIYKTLQSTVNKIVLIDDYFQPGTYFENIEIQNSSILENFNPDIVILATLKSRKRMAEQLIHCGYTGHICLLEGEDDDIFAAGDFVYNKDIAKLKNKHWQQPGYIIGNGPSLKKTDPRLIEQGITFAANAIYLLDDFQPDYYFCDDIYVAEQRADEINALNWNKFFPQDQKKWLKNGTFFNGKRVPRISKFTEDFADELEVNATVAYTMMQMAFHLGCDPVYLIGFDHNYEELMKKSSQNGNTMISNGEDHSHFHKDYFAKGTKWHFPWIERMDEAYKISLNHYKKNNRKIYNATKDGKLEIFPRIDFSKAISNAFVS